MVSFLWFERVLGEECGRIHGLEEGSFRACTGRWCVSWLVSQRNVGPAVSPGHPSDCCASESIFTSARMASGRTSLLTCFPSVDPLVSLPGLPSGPWAGVAPTVCSCCWHHRSFPPGHTARTVVLLSSVLCWDPSGGHISSVARISSALALLLLWLGPCHLSEGKLGLTCLYVYFSVLLAVLSPYSFG